MLLYSCLVNLNGDITQQVSKDDMTAAEAVLLRHIHNGSNEPVVNIRCTGKVDRSDAEERERLAGIYGQFGGLPGDVVVSRVLGVAGVPLPQEIAGVDNQVPEDAPPSVADVTTLTAEEVGPIVRAPRRGQAVAAAAG
jgi:hypothetical protein